MDADLERAYLRIMQAQYPEDVFGYENVVLPVETLLSFLTARYDELKAATDPKAYTHPNDVEAASDAQQMLESYHDRAQQRIRKQIYGIKGYDARPPHNRKSFDVGANTYYVGSKLIGGSRSTLYQSFMEHSDSAVGEVVIKLVDNSKDSYHAQNEARILTALHKHNVPQWKHLPLVFDTFRAGERIGLIQQAINGFSLSQVRLYRVHISGVDQRHMIWMLDRLLSCMGYVHSTGIVHGNLNPDHVLIQPATHNALVVGWGSAVQNPASSGKRAETVPDVFSAPECLTGNQIGPWSDVYSLGKIMIWLLGGDPVENSIPTSVEEPIRDFLTAMVEDSPTSRPDDCWELYEQENAIKDDLWQRKFLHFEMG